MKNKFIKYISFIICVMILLPTLVCCADKSQKPSFSLPDRSIEDTAVYTYGDYDYCIYTDNTSVIVEYKGNDTDVTIPEDLEGNKVVAIASGAFMRKENLKSVNIGNSVEIIGDLAFGGCTSLSRVTIGKKVWSIGPDAFARTPWYDSLVDEFVIVGDSLLLKYCGKDSVLTIPEEVKHIGPAFQGNEFISSATIGDNVCTVGSGAFLSSSVVNVSIGNSVILIDTYAFQGCEKLANLKMSDSVKQIGAYAFYGCVSLGHISLGRNVEQIDMYAFYLCTQIAYINIPSSLKTVAVDAFKDCYSIEYVFYEGTEAEFEAIDIETTNHIVLDAKKFYSYDYNGENNGSKN